MMGAIKPAAVTPSMAYDEAANASDAEARRHLESTISVEYDDRRRMKFRRWLRRRHLSDGRLLRRRDGRHDMNDA